MKDMTLVPSQSNKRLERNTVKKLQANQIKDKTSEFLESHKPPKLIQEVIDNLDRLKQLMRMNY